MRRIGEVALGPLLIVLGLLIAALSVHAIFEVHRVTVAADLMPGQGQPIPDQPEMASISCGSKWMPASDPVPYGCEWNYPDRVNAGDLLLTLAGFVAIAIGVCVFVISLKHRTRDTSALV